MDIIIKQKTIKVSTQKFEDKEINIKPNTCNESNSSIPHSSSLVRQLNNPFTQENWICNLQDAIQNIDELHARGTLIESSCNLE